MSPFYLQASTPVDSLITLC